MQVGHDDRVVPSLPPDATVEPPPSEPNQVPKRLGAKGRRRIGKAPSWRGPRPHENGREPFSRHV